MKMCCISVHRYCVKMCCISVHRYCVKMHTSKVQFGFAVAFDWLRK